MTIRIGHASIDENGNIAGGLPGDQTGREVCVRSWYAYPWAYLARARDSAVAGKIALACAAGCDNPNIGYSQDQRNTLVEAAKANGFDLSAVDSPCSADCSSFVSVCVESAGIAVAYTQGNAPTTRMLEQVLSATGAFDFLRSARLLSGTAGLRRGDILVAPGRHTAIVLDDGGWEPPSLSVGMSGASVRAVQLLLIGFGYDCGLWGADGVYGSCTREAVIRFQKAKNLAQDGIVGPETWRRLLGI